MPFVKSLTDAIKSAVTRKVYVKEDIYFESRKSSNYPAMIYSNYLKAAGIRFTVDRKLAHDVQNGLYGYTFEEALEKETAASAKVNTATTMRAGVPWVLDRLEKSLNEVANPPTIYSYRGSVDDANDWTATLQGLLDPTTGLLKGSEWDNAMAHGKLHALIYSDDPFEAALLNCRPALVHFVVVYESKIRSLDTNIPDPEPYTAEALH